MKRLKIFKRHVSLEEVNNYAAELAKLMEILRVMDTTHPNYDTMQREVKVMQEVHVRLLEAIDV